MASSSVLVWERGHLDSFYLTGQSFLKSGIFTKQDTNSGDLLWQSMQPVNRQVLKGGGEDLGFICLEIAYLIVKEIPFPPKWAS